MKILLSAFQCSPGRGSEPGNGWHWATALADIGHEVTVLTQPCFREPIQAANPQGIDFQFIDAPESSLRRLSPTLGRYDRYRNWQDAALRHIQAEPRRYDVAHHVTWGSLHLGSKLWQLPIPLVYGPIGGGQTAPASYWRYFGRNWPAEMLRTAATGPLLNLNSRSRDTIRNSSVILASNSATLTRTQRLGAANVRFMLSDALPRDWLVDARPRPTGIPVVLWIGRLLARKAPTLAVRAFAELRRTTPARMVIAGDGPLRGRVRATIERHGLSSDVQILGQVAWKDVRYLYDSASVFLFTSLRESLGTPFSEALGRGLPAVALDHHGIGDIEAGPAAIKVPLPERPRDLPGHLAAALREVLSDDQWGRRSVAAVNWASEQTWRARATAATHIYRELVQSGRDHAGR